MQLFRDTHNISIVGFFPGEFFLALVQGIWSFPFNQLFYNYENLGISIFHEIKKGAVGLVRSLDSYWKVNGKDAFISTNLYSEVYSIIVLDSENI